MEQCCGRTLRRHIRQEPLVGRRWGLRSGEAGGRPFLLHVFEAAVTGSGVGPGPLDAAWWNEQDLATLPFSAPLEREAVLACLRAEPPMSPAKLVRDGIPDIMAAAGTPGLFRLAAPSERRALLLAKVREEAAEVVASGGSVEEVADLLEVLAALRPEDEVRRARRAKHAARGAFAEGYVLLPR